MKINKIILSVLTVTALASEPLAAYAQTAENSPVLGQTAERANAARMSFTVDGITYDEQSDGTLAITGCDDKLTEVIIPADLDGQRVTRINANAFSTHTNLERVFIPESIEYIETINQYASYEQGMPFTGCENLQGIFVESANPNYCSKDGVLFNKDKTELIAYPAANKNTNYNIPKSVKRICNYAFAYCKYSESVTIPDSITVITDFAFYNCDALKKVELPDSITEIGHMAFYSCDNLASAIIPYGVVKIGDFAFYSCKSLLSVTIPESVTSLGQEAFQDCSGLKTAKIWANIKYLDRTFRVCSNLETIILPQSLTSIKEDTFYHATKLKNIYFMGTKTQWAKMGINGREDYEIINNATVHCNYIPPVEPVTGFKATANSTSVTLKWAKNPTADSYKIKQLVNGQYKTLIKTADNSTTTYTVTGLSPNTDYSFEIYAFSGTTFSAPARTSVKTPAGKPAAVTDFKGTPSSSSIKLTWAKNDGADSYKIKQLVNGSWKELVKTSSNGTTSYTVTGLKENTEYQFVIYAFSGTQFSTAVRVTVRTTTAKPSAVTGFKGTPTSNSVKLTWTKNTGADSYKIKQLVNGSWKELAKTASNTTTSYTVSGLKADTEYQFAIYAFNGTKFSAAAKVTVKTSEVTAKPSAVTGFKGTPTSNSVKLTWNKNTTADSYKIKQMVNGKWKELAKTADNSITSYTINGLAPNTEYQFVIYAFKGTQFSAAAKVKVKTAGSKPAAVTGFSGAVAQDYVVLSWNKSSDADSYKIKQLVNGSWKEIVKTADNSTTSFTVNGLEPNTEYQFAIYAFNGTQFSAAKKLTVQTAG